MALNANKADTGSKYPRTVLEPGTYPARVLKVLDIGLQPNRPYQGQPKEPTHQIMVTYELADEFLLDEDGQPQEDKPKQISERFSLFSLSSERATSTKRYLAIDPQKEADGDFAALVGKPVNLTLVNNPGKDGKVWENVGGLSLMRQKDADKCPALVGTATTFDLDEPDMEVFNSLHDWEKKVITDNLNYQGSKLQALVDGEEQVETEDVVATTKEDDENPF